MERRKVCINSRKLWSLNFLACVCNLTIWRFIVLFRHSKDVRIGKVATPCAHICMYLCVNLSKHSLGMPDTSKTDEFLEKFRKGGGHFQSKNLYCKIWTFKQGFLTMKMIQKGLFMVCFHPITMLNICREICNITLRKFIRFGEASLNAFFFGQSNC